MIRDDVENPIHVFRPPTPPRRRRINNDILPPNAHVVNFNAIRMVNWLVLAVKIIGAAFFAFLFFVLEYFVS